MYGKFIEFSGYYVVTEFKLECQFFPVASNTYVIEFKLKLKRTLDPEFERSGVL